MAKIKQRTHSKKRTKKVGGNSGYRVCKNCGSYNKRTIIAQEEA